MPTWQPTASKNKSATLSAAERLYKDDGSKEYLRRGALLRKTYNLMYDLVLPDVRSFQLGRAWGPHHCAERLLPFYISEKKRLAESFAWARRCRWDGFLSFTSLAALEYYLSHDECLSHLTGPVNTVRSFLNGLLCPPIEATVSSEKYEVRKRFIKLFKTIRAINDDLKAKKTGIRITRSCEAEELHLCGVIMMLWRAEQSRCAFDHDHIYGFLLNDFPSIPFSAETQMHLANISGTGR